MASAERKDFNKADETRTFERGKVDLVNIGGGSVGRLTLEPGRAFACTARDGDGSTAHTS